MRVCIASKHESEGGRHGQEEEKAVRASERQISIRSIRRDPPDYRKLAAPSSRLR